MCRTIYLNQNSNIGSFNNRRGSGSINLPPVLPSEGTSLGEMNRRGSGTLSKAPIVKESSSSVKQTSSSSSFVKESSFGGKSAKPYFPIEQEETSRSKPKPAAKAKQALEAEDMEVC